MKNSDRHLLSLIVHGDEGDAGLEYRNLGRILHIRDGNFIGDRGITSFHILTLDTQNRPVTHAVAEFDLVHTYRHELAMGKFSRSRDPGRLIDPRQQTTAEQGPVVIEIAW